MRAGLRSKDLQYARRLPAAIHNPPDDHSNTSHCYLRLLKAPVGAHGRVRDNSGGSRSICVRSHPADLRVRRQFSDPEVFAGAEHCGAQRLHIILHHIRPRLAVVAGGVQAGLGSLRGGVRAELVVVDCCHCPVRIHS